MLNGKAAEMMIRAAVNAMGIDADSLLANIQQFQQWVQNAVQHHDKRLVALENQGVVNGEKLSRILELLEISEARIQCLTGCSPVIDHSDGESPDTPYAILEGANHE